MKVDDDEKEKKKQTQFAHNGWKFFICSNETFVVGPVCFCCCYCKWMSFFEKRFSLVVKGEFNKSVQVHISLKKKKTQRNPKLVIKFTQVSFCFCNIVEFSDESDYLSLNMKKHTLNISDSFHITCSLPKSHLHVSSSSWCRKWLFVNQKRLFSKCWL